MITEDYCSFETAKLLKEKGFDGDCDYYYDTVETDEPQQLTLDEKLYFRDRYIDAPTHQMAMKWLREKKDIFIDIGYDDLDFYWLIESIANDVPIQDRPKLLRNGTACHRTYEEAVEQAIKYVLENMI